MKVLFGDTGMEFPDTYDVVDKIKEKCEEEGIADVETSAAARHRPALPR